MSYTPGPWSQGRTLMTSQTRRWSAAELTENDLVERRMVFANFLALDDGRSRRRVAVCESEADARLIAAAPELYEALVMMRDADNDCHADGLPTIPSPARAKIDAAIAKAERRG